MYATPRLYSSFLLFAHDVVTFHVYMLVRCELGILTVLLPSHIVQLSYKFDHSDNCVGIRGGSEWLTTCREKGQPWSADKCKELWFLASGSKVHYPLSKNKQSTGAIFYEP